MDPININTPFLIKWNRFYRKSRLLIWRDFVFCFFMAETETRRLICVLFLELPSKVFLRFYSLNPSRWQSRQQIVSYILLFWSSISDEFHLRKWEMGHLQMASTNVMYHFFCYFFFNIYLKRLIGLCLCTPPFSFFFFF